MPKFVTIGHGDEAEYDRTPVDVRNAAHAQDDALKQKGAIMGVAGSPVLVRNHEGAGVTRENKAYLTSPLPIAGFAIIEAANLDEAIKMVSKVPCAVCDGVVEVWPLLQTPN
jgi:hypothetical protein